MDDYGFKFKIGNYASLRQDVEEKERKNKSKEDYYIDTPNRFLIIERRLDECHGGIQRHYGVRAFTRDGATTIHYYSEIELVQPKEETNGVDK